jgi:Ca-activated chloride channel family protein
VAGSPDGGKGDGRPGDPGQPQPQRPGSDDLEAVRPSNDRYPALAENRFVTVEGQRALSTFGVDVDTASYAIVRKYLSMGQLPPRDAVRLEELVNYFPYRDKAPDGNDPFAVTVELAECPWQPKHRLARIGLKAKPIATDKRPPSNLVFLIDVSGSMNEPNKLPLVKASLKLLVNQLGENDRVAMVVYAGTTGLVLDSTSAMHKDRILGALDRLEAGGSTNGSGGMQQAYSVAAANFIKGGTNRVILCTDGDWNVGTTSTEALVRMVEEKRGTGVFLSVFGFGMGNLRDEMMVKLAGKGNGNYGYIDTLKEAHKALVEQLGGTLVTVAKDVKIQVEFNPAVVGAYRLLGYEKRRLAAKDFHDDKKDAGEMGAGHVVTALYELVPAGEAVPADATVGEGLRYQQNDAPKVAAKAGKSKESFVVKMRHKKPDGDTSTLRELPVTDPGKGYEDASEDFRFAAAVASFAMLLRESPYKGNATFAAVQELAGAALKHDPGGYRAEFLELVRQAKAISGRP